MRRVLDHGQAADAGQRGDDIELHRMAGVVDGKDRPGPGRDRRRNPLGIDVQGIRLDVDQDGPGSDVLDHVDRGAKRHRGRDDLVARADPERRERGVEPGGARVQRQGALGPHERREFSLEGARLRAGGDPGRLERVDHRIDFRLPDLRRGEREEGSPARRGGRAGYRDGGGNAAGGHAT